MITITVAFITSIVVSVGTTAGLYWYLHRNNPDLAQKVTDAVVETAKSDAVNAAEAIKDKVS